MEARLSTAEAWGCSRSTSRSVKMCGHPLVKITYGLDAWPPYVKIACDFVKVEFKEVEPEGNHHNETLGENSNLAWSLLFLKAAVQSAR